MPHLTAAAREMIRPRVGRLPRDHSTSPWIDHALSSWPDADAGLSDWTVPNRGIQPDGVDVTMDGTYHVGFWTEGDGTWAAMPPIDERVPGTRTLVVPNTRRPETAAIAWYFDISGVGPGGRPGVSVDELLLAAPPVLLDDSNFVTVAGDADATNSANQAGWVDTGDAVRVVTATLVEENCRFDGWVCFGAGIEPRGADLHLDQGASGWALATYLAPSDLKLPPGVHFIPQSIRYAAVQRALSGVGENAAVIDRLAVGDLIRDALPSLGETAVKAIGVALDDDAHELLTRTQTPPAHAVAPSSP